MEDTAYCLMGLFDINVPLLYGEGEKAFIRHQDEIMKDMDDQTLFLWETDNMSPHMPPQGLLAQSPAELKGSADTWSCITFPKLVSPLRPRTEGLHSTSRLEHGGDMCTMIYECQAASKPDIRLIGIKLQSIPDCDSQFLRVNHPLIRDISVGALHGAVLETVYVIKDHAGIMHPSLLSSSYSHCTLSLAHSLRERGIKK